MPLTVSVAMCTYNGARFLREQLDSLAVQTYLPTELVICDDMSTDETINIIKDFKQDAPFCVRLILNNNRLFFQRNFVKAATLCTSEIIAFCDQDDIWMPEKLEIILDNFKDKNVMLVTHQARLIDEAGSEIAPQLPDADFAPIYNQLKCRPWNFSRGFTQVFRSQIILFAPLHDLTVGFSKTDHYISHDLWTQIICNCLGKVLWLNTPLANYRQHEANLFGIRNDIYRNDISYVQQENFESYRKASIVHNVFIASEKMPELFALKNKIAAAKNHWKWTSKIFYFRYKIYTESSMILRVKYFTSLLIIGAYDSNRKWAFSRRSILKDAFISIFNFRLYDLLQKIVIPTRYSR